MHAVLSTKLPYGDDEPSYSDFTLQVLIARLNHGILNDPGYFLHTYDYDANPQHKIKSLLSENRTFSELRTPSRIMQVGFEIDNRNMVWVNMLCPG